MPSSLKDIYNALREDQQFSQTKDYGTFAKRMNERGYSQMIYNNLKTAGASLPDVNTFRKRLGLKDWSAPSTKPVAKSKSQVTPSYADYSATNYNPSSASQGNGVKDKYRYPGLSVPMNSGGTEDTTSSGNESALVRSLRKTDSRKSQPSMRKPIGKVMVENRDEEAKNLRGAASEIANEGEKPAYNLGDETTSQYLSKRKSDVAKEHDKVRSVSEAVWDNASKVAGEEFNDYIRERNEMNFTNVVRELAKGASPSRMSEDNWEVGTEAMASHLRNHDLEKLSDAAWNALGESGQKDLINDYYSKILQQYPHADHNEAYEEATKMARAESDNQMYQTAVSKNAPKDVADFFFRKAARTNTVGNIMEANARVKAGTRGDMDARDEADARYEQDHKVAGIGGMVAGFATDPLTAVSGGVGSATAKGAAALAGKAFGQAAVRKFGTTLGGKILTGTAAGMGNLGTLEAGSNVAEQLRQGGWNDEEGKFHEGFSEGQVLKQGLHGAGMGALTGVVSPVIGNVADKAVRATSSTAGKIGIRAGEVGSSILAEGTIFSIPEWMDGKRDKMDVWTDNLAQMAGMKVQGGFKTVANTLAGLHGNAKTGFRERINGILDGNRQDLALTKDERAELEQGGYTDLKQLTDDAVAFKSKKAAPKDGKTVTTTDDGKDVPVNRFEELMADKNISEAARAKMYYYLTGHTLPMSTVTGGSMSTTKDADGKVTGYTVESTGYNGVITRRHFTDRKSADREMDRVHRQAELNNIGIGEHLYDEKTVKVGKPVEEGSAKLRSDIMDEYGIDVNEAFKKSYDKRSEEEQEAIDAYSDRLYDVTRNAESAEDTDPMGLSVAEREGADIVEENHLGTETPQTEAVQSAVTELRQAQTAWAEAMKSDTSLAEGFKAAQEKGIGMVEAYEWMLEQGYGTEESLAPLADVIGASVKVASMWRGTKESIEKTTQDHVSTWQWEGTDFGQGEVTEPTMLYVTDKNGHRLIVKSGHIKFDAKGNAIEGDMIICLDETTGDMVHPSVKDVKFQGTESAKDYADRYRQRLQEINSKGYEALQVTPAEAEGKAEDKTVPEETSEPGLPFSDETPKTEPSEASQDIPAEGEPGTPDNGKIEGNYDKESGIPLDEEGEPLYEQVSKEQTVEDIFGKLDDANLARDYAKHKVSEAEKKLKSVSGMAPKMGTKINEYARKKAEYEAKVKEAQASVDYWKSVVEDIEKLTHTTDEELAEQKRELDGTAAKEDMKDNHEFDVPDSGVALAASVLADAKVTPESLKKETGYETKDLNKFVGMLAKKENGGADLVSLAEKLVEMDEQYNNRFFGGDAQEARNALLEALGQAKTRGELRALARPDEAKAIKEREEQRDKAYHDAYGMSYEEYLDFAEQEMAHLIGGMAHFDEEKYLQDYAAEITKQIDKEHGTGIEGHESAGEEPVHGTGSEVLSGEGVDDRGGSGSVEGHGEGKEEVRGGDRADAALEGETSGGELTASTGTASARRRRKGFKSGIAKKTQEEIFAEEQSKMYSGDVRDILVSCKTWQEAYDRFIGKADECLKKADEWRAKKYKKHGGSVEVGGKYDDFDAKNVSIDRINERRRENAIRNLEEGAKMYRDFAEQLRAKCEKGVSVEKKAGIPANPEVQEYDWSQYKKGDVFDYEGYKSRYLFTEKENDGRVTGVVVEHLDDNGYAVGRESVPPLMFVEHYKKMGDAEQPKAVREQKADGVKALSSRERVLRDAVVDRMRDAGLDANMDVENGQKVLDEANEEDASKERSEKAREQRVFHGSSADFDRFDHSHMGEGEGAQAYGWGTYVTEVEGIGKAYAEVARRNAGVRREGLLSNINRAKAQLPFMREGEYKTELERQIAEWEEESAKPSDGRLLYTVEIPDDNGQNYLDWKEKPTKQQKETIIRALMDFNRIDVDDIREMLKMPSKYSDDDVLRTEVGAHVLGNSGSDLYHSLSVYFGNDEMASKFLAEAGFAGIKYPADYRRGGRADGAKDYVIFNEANAKIVDKVRYFRTANGEAYGFTVAGKIYIDPRIAGSDTPIHEYAHLWASALRACNHEEWKNVVALMKGTSVWDEVKERYPDLKTDDEIADEVLAHYSGRRGAERLREEARKIADGNGGVLEKAEAISALECVKQALQKFWKGVCDFLHIHYTSAEEVADRVMKDLLDGVDPRKMAKANDEGRTLLDVDGKTSAESSSVGHSPAEVVEHVAKVAEKTGGKVEQVNSVDEIANEKVKADIEAGKKVQGWYDEKTGKVYLYMPNIHDRYTAERVVWHETVGHKGMRGLLGNEGFKQYMKDLWYDLDNPVNAELRQYVRDRMANDHLSMYDAIEEFIADAAEKGKGTAGFWNNVKNKVSNVLHEIGYRISPNVKDVQYMLWLAKNVQKNPNDPVWKMRAEAAKWKIEHSDMHLSEERGGEIADAGSHKSLDEMTDAEIGRETDCKVHYSTAPSTATEIDLYNRAVGNVNAMLKESYQDSMNSLTELMKALIPGMKRVEDVRATLNPRMMENLMAGRISAKGRKFANQEMKRLDRAYVGVLDAFNGKNTEERMREASLYMIEKHGLERNRVFYVRDKIAKERESNSMFADQLQQDWNVKKKELGDKLRNGQIDLKEYYKQMDEWIRGNVDRNYIASEHDYSGMHGMQGIANLRDAYDDAGAIAHVMDCEAKMENNKNGSMSELWSATKDATNFSIHEEYSSGYLSKDRYESLRDMFDWYVPLRKYDETTMEDVYTYIHGHVGSSNSIGMTVQKAKGRKSLSDVNILAQIGAMASGALYRGGSNEVRQAFARMVGEYEKAPTDERVVTEIKGWAVKTTDSNGNVVWTEAHPPIPADDTNQETIAQEYYNWNQQMEAKKATGDAVEITGQSNIPYKFLPKGDRSQHIVSVWINGKRRDYLINGNPRAAQAVNGMLNNESAKGALSAVNRFLAQSVTSWNPEFTLRNTVRDFGFASHLLEAKEGVNYWSKFEKHFFAMGLAPVGRTITAKSMADVKNGLFVNLFKRYEQGTLDYNKPYHKWFAEFMDNGGMTGIATQQRFDEWKKKVVKDVAKMREGYMRHPWTLTKDIFSTIEVANEMAENITRFATFCASRESGRTAARSAYDAHEVSVNFNTRGSGNAVKTYSYEGMGDSAKALRNATGFFTGWMRNYTMFFNASVQSFCAFSRNIKAHPVRATATLMALPFAVGALMPWVNGLMQAWCDSDEDKKRLGIPDDPYGELPEYIRRDNLCFYIGKGEFVTVPLGIETRAFYGLGDLAAGYTFHPELQSQKNVAMDVAGQLSQIVPVGDFMSGSSFGDNAKGDAVTILNKFLPSMYTPLSELVFNIDWKGQPIMRDGDYLDNSPSWMRAPRGTLTPLVNLNKKVNADTNDIMPGNENMKGDEVLDAMTNPALIEHLLDSYVGGTGTFVKRTGKVVNRAIIKAQGGNADIESKDIPFVRSLLYTPSETNAMARTKAKWYKYKEDIEKDAANMKVLKRRNVPLDEQIANYAQLQKLQNNANAQRVNIYERASKQIKRLNKRKARAQDDEESKYFDQQVNMIMEDAVKEMDAIKEK